MKINNIKKQIDVMMSDVNFDYYMKKDRGNGIYLSDEEVDILKKYNINYKASSIKELLLIIDYYLQEKEAEDLEWLIDNLKEQNYYQNTNK